MMDVFSVPLWTLQPENGVMLYLVIKFNRGWRVNVEYVKKWRENMLEAT